MCLWGKKSLTPFSELWPHDPLTSTLCMAQWHALPPGQRVLHVRLLPGGRLTADRVQDPGREVLHLPRHEGREEQEDGVPHQHHHHPQQSGDDGIQSCHQWSFLGIFFRDFFSQGVHLDPAPFLQWHGSSVTGKTKLQIVPIVCQGKVWTVLVKCEVILSQIRREILQHSDHAVCICQVHMKPILDQFTNFPLLGGFSHKI